MRNETRRDVPRRADDNLTDRRVRHRACAGRRRQGRGDLHRHQRRPGPGPGGADRHATPGHRIGDLHPRGYEASDFADAGADTCPPRLAPHSATNATNATLVPAVSRASRSSRLSRYSDLPPTHADRKQGSYSGSMTPRLTKRYRMACVLTQNDWAGARSNRPAQPPRPALPQRRGARGQGTGHRLRLSDRLDDRCYRSTLPPRHVWFVWGICASRGRDPARGSSPTSTPGPMWEAGTRRRRRERRRSYAALPHTGRSWMTEADAAPPTLPPRLTALASQQAVNGGESALTQWPANALVGGRICGALGRIRTCAHGSGGRASVVANGLVAAPLQVTR